MQSLAKEFRVNDLAEGPADIAFPDQYKLRITSKKLSSGKCQVKFHAYANHQKNLYGYVLVDSDRTLKEVVVKIREKLMNIQQARDFHQIHLYSIGQRTQDDELSFMVFDS
jgi:hypothetical protein